MTKTELNKMLTEMTEAKSVTAEIVECGGLSHKTTQSDKLGYDWDETLVGETIVRKEYVLQTPKRGVNYGYPIIWFEGVPMIESAYYLKEDEGKVYLCTDGQLYYFCEESEMGDIIDADASSGTSES